MNRHDPMLQRQQLAEQRRKVDFDTYDVTVEELVRRVERRRIEIAPIYQRQFRWDPVRQSRLVESMLLGIPVPPLFMATNLTPDAATQWEVVDGLQRMLTLVNFAGGEEARVAAHLTDEPLSLSELDKLTELEGLRFNDLPEDIRTALQDRPVKVIVLNDKSDLQVRFDLFERLNTGGISLTPQEVRGCVFRGPFMDLLSNLSQSKDFKTVVRLPKTSWMDGTPEEYVLRFFAFLDKYREFDHSVIDFLNNFASSATKDPMDDERRGVFTSAFHFLADAFPNGITSRRGMTPVNLFEGIAVGAALALREREGSLLLPDAMDWVSSDKLRQLTTGATNSRLRVMGRIEFSRDRFLGLPLDV